MTDSLLDLLSKQRPLPFSPPPSKTLKTGIQHREADAARRRKGPRRARVRAQGRRGRGQEEDVSCFLFDDLFAVLVAAFSITSTHVLPLSLSLLSTLRAANAPSKSTSLASKSFVRGRKLWPLLSPPPRQQPLSAPPPTQRNTSLYSSIWPCKPFTSWANPRPCLSGGNATPLCSPRSLLLPRRSSSRRLARELPRSLLRLEFPTLTSCPRLRAKLARGRLLGE